MRKSKVYDIEIKNGYGQPVVFNVQSVKQVWCIKFLDGFYLTINKKDLEVGAYKYRTHIRNQYIFVFINKA